MKIIKIESCMECPHVCGPNFDKESHEFRMYCCEVDQILEIEEDIIPKWCPLEEI